MKVLRIVSELDFGGVEQVVALSIPFLAKSSGMEVKVIVLGAGGRISDRLIKDGFPVVILNQKSKIPNLKLLWRLKKLLQIENPDIIHCQGAEANFHGLWAAKLAGVKTKIGEEIGLPNHHSYWKWIFKWVYQKADAVIAISEAVKKRIVELGEVEEGKVRVVYNPVSSEQFSVGSEQCSVASCQLSVPPRRTSFSCQCDPVFSEEIAGGVNMLPKKEIGDDKEFVFITTCRLVPIKNLERLIQCFYEVVGSNPDQKLALWILGDGPEKGRLIELTQSLNLSNNLKFFGFQENVTEYLKAADAFILPSLSEGSSVSLAEAMMAGLPSIVTEVGGAGEILGNSNSGLLVNPLSTDSIFSAMQSMIDFTEEELMGMGERAREEAKRFSIDNYIQSLLSIYHGH